MSTLQKNSIRRFLDQKNGQKIVYDKAAFKEGDYIRNKKFNVISKVLEVFFLNVWDRKVNRPMYKLKDIKNEGFVKLQEKSGHSNPSALERGRIRKKYCDTIDFTYELLDPNAVKILFSEE